jgi:uncharacterized ferredoxin-like protein
MFGVRFLARGRAGSIRHRGRIMVGIHLDGTKSLAAALISFDNCSSGLQARQAHNNSQFCICAIHCTDFG